MKQEPIPVGQSEGIRDGGELVKSADVPSSLAGYYPNPGLVLIPRLLQVNHRWPTACCRTVVLGWSGLYINSDGCVELPFRAIRTRFRVTPNTHSHSFHLHSRHDRQCTPTHQRRATAPADAHLFFGRRSPRAISPSRSCGADGSPVGRSLRPPMARTSVELVELTSCLPFRRCRPDGPAHARVQRTSCLVRPLARSG